MESIRALRYSQLGILLAALVLLGIFAFAVHTLRSFQITGEQVLHTQELRLRTSETLSLLKDYHNQTRAYLTSGDERALAARQQPIDDFVIGLARLRELTAGLPAQRQFVEQLEALLPRLTTEYDAYIEARRTGGLAAATARVNSGEGRRLADELKALTANFTETETKRFEQLLEGARHESRLTLGVLFGGLGLAVALVVAVIVTLRRDYRLREAAAAALRYERYLLGELMDNATECIYFKDRESRFTRINRGLAQRFGLANPADAIGKRDFDFYAEEHARRAFEDEQAIVRTGHGVTQEEKETWPDGSVTWVLTVKQPLRDKSGAIVGTFGLSRDITERKEAEAKLEKLNASLRARGTELEAANRELEAFSYSVSHDLRAPLRHIDYFASALQKQLAPGQTDAKAQRYLETISSSARNMGQLIDDLLSFARIGRTELQRSRVSLDELVSEIRQGLQTETTGRTIRWDVAALPSVTGDPALLRQVFVNLLSNAVKYTRPRTEARIEIAVEPAPPGEVVVRVSDNGAGFDMQYADKLFGVFQRLHGNSEFEGTGVGLANVRRIVERHGGRVWAEAAVDRGATFRVSLPANPGNNGNGNGTHHS